MLIKSSRRIAQRQSASKHTEEAAAFDSCSAYQVFRLSVSERKATASADGTYLP